MNVRVYGFGPGCLAVLTVMTAHLTMAATPLGPPTYGNPDQTWGTRRPVVSSDQATLNRYRSGRSQPTYRTDFSDVGSLAVDWIAQLDNRYDLNSCRERQNVVASPTGLLLKTLQAQHCHSTYSTGSIWSRARYRFGFFEARMRIGDTSGLNNAFWLMTNDKFEIDIAEVHYPNIVRISLHNNNNWSPDPSHAVGFDVRFRENLSEDYHDYGLIWTPTDLIFEVDGTAVAAMVTAGAIHGTADLRFSTAIGSFAGQVPEDPIGHQLDVRSLKVFSP